MNMNQFPHEIIKEVIRLYQNFYQIFNIKSPIIRATAVSYFYKYFQVNNSNPPENAIASISCFNISAKVCEFPISFKRYINEIKHNSKSGITSSFINIFQILDGIPSSNLSNFHEILLQKLVQKEIQIIISLQFNFTIQLPYELSEKMIDKILKWHIKTDDQIFSQLSKELVLKCWKFFNDLQTSEIFYKKPAEIIAISIIELIFLLFELPLISPKNSPWFTFLVPDADIKEIDQLTSEIKKLFYLFFSSTKIRTTFKLKVEFDKKILTEWIRFPLIPPKKVPICNPPSLTFLDNIVSGDDSFKNCEFNHLPNFPPPEIESKTAPNSNLLQIQDEYSLYLKQ